MNIAQVLKAENPRISKREAKALSHSNLEVGLHRLDLTIPIPPVMLISSS